MSKDLASSVLPIGLLVPPHTVSSQTTNAAYLLDILQNSLIIDSVALSYLSRLSLLWPCLTSTHPTTKSGEPNDAGALRDNL